MSDPTMHNGELYVPVGDPRSLRAILTSPENREALKALLTEDGPVTAREKARWASGSGLSWTDQVSVAVDALDVPKVLA